MSNLDLEALFRVASQNFNFQQYSADELDQQAAESVHGFPVSVGCITLVCSHDC